MHARLQLMLHTCCCVLSCHLCTARQSTSVRLPTSSCSTTMIRDGARAILPFEWANLVQRHHSHMAVCPRLAEAIREPGRHLRGGKADCRFHNKGGGKAAIAGLRLGVLRSTQKVLPVHQRRQFTHHGRERPHIRLLEAHRERNGRPTFKMTRGRTRQPTAATVVRLGSLLG